MNQTGQFGNPITNPEQFGLAGGPRGPETAVPPPLLPREGIVLMQDSTSAEEKKKSFVTLHFMGEVFISLMLAIALSFSIKQLYDNPGTDMSGIFGCAILANILFVVLNAVLAFGVDKGLILGPFWAISSIKAATKAFAYLGFYLFAKDINNNMVRYCVYPDLIFRLALYCSRFARTQAGQTIPLLHSFSLLIIAGFVEDNSLYALSMAFLVYYFFGAFLMSLVILAWMVFGFLMKVYLSTPDLLNTFFPDLLTHFLKKIGLFFIFCGWLSCHTFTYIMFVWGLHQFLARGLLKPSILPAPMEMPNNLGVAGTGLGQLGTFDLCLFVFALFAFKTQLRELFDKFKGKEITFQLFKESIKLNLQKRGENYFKRASGIQEPLIELQPPAAGDTVGTGLTGGISQFGECQICMTNTCDTWFEPCGHTVVCQHCLEDFLKKYDSCIHCRGKIDKVHLIYWDPATRSFKSQGAYNLTKR